MRLAVLVLLAGACKKDSPVEPALTPVAPVAAAPAAPEPAPPADAAPDGVDAMIRPLSARDAGPSCAEVEAHAADPVAALSYIVAHVPMPPQAPMRAATCLVDRHPEAVADDLVRWVKDDGMQGLGRLVLQRLDDLPEPIAVRVARAAVVGPLAEEALPQVRASARQAVRDTAPPSP